MFGKMLHGNDAPGTPECECTVARAQPEPGGLDGGWAYV